MALFDVDALRMRDAGREEMSEADMQRYEKYLASDLDLASLAKVTKRQMDRIKVGWSNLPCLFAKLDLICNRKSYVLNGSPI